MKQPLNGLWQLSPLTDLSIPQDDLTFPNPLSSALPAAMDETDIAKQEWHLMHDIEVTEQMLNYKVIELVLGGIEYHAEVRLNGVALFDCDKSANNYRKDIRSQLKLGRNRFEILFLEDDEDLWFDDEDNAKPSHEPILNRATVNAERRIGIWQTPYLLFSQYIQLHSVEVEQIWHPVGGCEVKVGVRFLVVGLGLVSAKVKFNGMTLTLPLDLRHAHAIALFQVDAPVTEGEGSNYCLNVDIDGYQVETLVPLSPEAPIQTVELTQL
jgi:hypothetical protein